MSDLSETARKMVSTLVRVKGNQYTVGYLESLLVSVIERNVTDPEKLYMLRLELMDIGINTILDEKA